MVEMKKNDTVGVDRERGAGQERRGGDREQRRCEEEGQDREC